MTQAFYGQLTPFVSLTLARARNVPSSDQLLRCMQDIRTICAPGAGVGAAVTDLTIFDEYKAGGVSLRALRYKRAVQAAWTNDPAILDTQQHLVIAIVRKQHLALHCTDPKLKGRMRAALLGTDPAQPLEWLAPVPRDIMSAAFLADGQARTLWLSGIHRRSATRADAKILAGQDLDYSLDPFDDQSFYWSAARSRSAALEVTVGVSPKASRVWVGKAPTLKDFAKSTAMLIDAVVGARAAGGEPFRFLAVPMEALDPAVVTRAYDISVLPPDMLDDADDAVDDVNADAELVYATSLAAASAGGADVDVDVECNGQLLGRLRLGVAIARDGKVKLSASDVRPAGIDDPAFERMKTLLGKGAGVNIRYDSGHSISDRRVYATRMRKVSFAEYETRDFGDFNVKQEKPEGYDKIGKEKSLFCWVQTTHKGWLACDDGANEKADFIHLEEVDGRPVLSLIHVKGAKSDSAGRKISVSAYEVVTGQAVKNLQWLDRQNLAEGLKASVRASGAWWHDGVPVTQDDFAAAIDALGDDFTRRVVIVQPHVTEASHTAAVEAADKSLDRVRLDQLNTLLASAWRACNGLGVKFKVIWSD